MDKLEQRKQKALSRLESGGPGSIFECKINDHVFQGTYKMLRMWPTCWQPDAKYDLNYRVETAQSDWVCAKLEPGQCGLDIGSSFGVITMAMARKAGPTGSVHAFEPARQTRALLEKTLAANDCQNVVVVKDAISDSKGSCKFIEYTSDNELEWAPDGSTLDEGRGPILPEYEEYEVPIITMDEYVFANEIQPKSIKMDIEGAELYALQGGRETIQSFMPAFCIDIHLDMRTGVDAEESVRELLGSHGYRLTKRDHALYADDPASEPYVWPY